MTDWEKLVKLINHVSEGHISNLMQPGGAEELADCLIAHGVMVKESQKPLTEEEVRAESEEPKVVWVEWPLGGGLWPCVIALVEDDDCYFTDNTWEKMRWYGRLWRCWAEKPTEEEREAAEWE